MALNSFIEATKNNLRLGTTIHSRRWLFATILVMDRTQISPKFEHSELWTKVSSQIFLNSSNYSFLPFSRLIWIFVNVLAAQTSTGQAGSKFKTIRQSVWKNNSRDFKKIWLLYPKGLLHFRPKPKTSQVLKDWTQTWRGSTQLYLLKKEKKPRLQPTRCQKLSY